MSLTRRTFNVALAQLTAAGLLLIAETGAAQTPLPRYACTPNDAGDGWDCELISGTAPGSQAPRQSTTPSQPPSTPDPETETRPDADGDAAQTDDPPEPDEDFSLTLTQTDNTGYPLDWVPIEAMTPAQRENLEPYCCGAFIDPLTGQVDPEADPEQSATDFNSSSGINQLSPDQFSIAGDVVVRQGYRVISNTEQTSIDREARTLQLQGDVRFREPGLLIRGESAFIDGEARINRIDGASYVLHDYRAHGEAGSIVYDGEAGLVTIENGEFSRCEPGQDFWRLSAGSIVLDPERRRGYASDVSLRVADVPILYYPFTMAFPLGDERISGLLAPSFGSTRTGGTEFELPYYWNIAPQADATFTPRLVSDRGIMGSVEVRYLASWSMNQVNGSWMPDDDLYDPTSADLPGSESPPVPDRWVVDYDHQGRLGRNWTTFVDYNAVSDTDYFYDLGGRGLEVASRTHLNRQGRLNYGNDWLRAGVNVQRIQVIDPLANANNINKPFDRAPQFYFDTGGYLGAGFDFDLTGQVTSFDRDLDENRLSTEQIMSGALINGQRINLEPALGWSVESPGWFLRTGASYKYIEYRLQNEAAETPDAPDIGVPVYSADAGLVFERQRSGGGVQTLEPRLFYLNSEFQRQDQLPLFDTSELNFSFNQLFREDRFAGGDRVGDANQLSVALTSRLLNASGQERARVSIGQIRYFEDRQVSLSNPLQDWPSLYALGTDKSALAGELALFMGENWRLSSDFQWNEEREHIDEGSVQLRYHNGARGIFNVSYRFRRLVNSPNFVLPPTIDPRIKQTDLSAAWPVNENWSLLGRWYYDHANERHLESFAGIEWRNCCATIRLVGREWVDENELFVPNSEPNRGIYVQFTLHGLGNVAGGSLSNLLQDGIWGFRETDYE